MEIIGILAGILTLSTYIPQTVKTLRTKQTRDLSFGTYMLLVVSAFMWFIYGVGSHLPSVWVTNIIVGTLGLLILVTKTRNRP
jgi:MtN3 and saliva related transmembrane protein